MLSIREVCERIWEMEDALRLFERPLGGITLWPLVRMKLYYRICRAAGIFSTPHSEKVSLRNGLAAALNTVAAPFTSPVATGAKKRYLVFDHPRKVPVDGTYVDIYTRRLLETLPAEETEVFENWHLGRHWMGRGPARSYLDDLAVGASLAALVPFGFSGRDKAAIREIEEAIADRFDVALPLATLFSKELRHHRHCERYYTKLLQRRRPERVFLVVSYGHYKRALITAAKRLGIETVELQHGTFSPYHLGYNFPGVDGPVDCFPDTFYAFGDYWRDLAKMPIGRDRIETFGFDHFNRQAAAVRDTPRDPRCILVISQGVIGKALSRFVRDLAEALEGYRIVCKLHPGEYALWRRDYPELVAASRRPNVEVVDADTVGLYRRFAGSRYVVGVFSTAIYEGLALGCTTFVVDLPGVEYMDYLVEKEMVFKVSRPEEVAQLIASGASPARFDAGQIFADTAGRAGGAGR